MKFFIMIMEALLKLDIQQVVNPCGGACELCLFLFPLFGRAQVVQISYAINRIFLSVSFICTPPIKA